MPQLPAKRWEYREPTDYMVGYIPDLTYENVGKWIADENLATCEKREFRVFTLWAGVDGNVMKDREVTFGRIVGPSSEAQHMHPGSDAFIIVTGGRATLLMGEIRNPIEAPKLIQVPKGTPHGFEVAEGETFEFLAVQVPPIRDPHTGEEDYELV